MRELSSSTTSVCVGRGTVTSSRCALAMTVRRREQGDSKRGRSGEADRIFSRKSGASTAWLLGLALSLLVAPSETWANSSVLKVDLKDGAADPANPTVNLWSNDSISVRVGDSSSPSLLDDLKSKPSKRLVAFFDLPRWAVSNGQVVDEQVVGGVAQFSEATGLAVRFYRCDDEAIRGLADNVARAQKLSTKRSVDSFNKELGKLGAVTSPSRDLEKDTSDSRAVRCGFAVHEVDAPSWTIVADAGTVSLVLALADLDAGSPGGLRLSQTLTSVPIAVERKPFNLEWSLGASFLKVDDRRFRLLAIPGDSEHLMLERTSDQTSRYEFAAFAHYMAYGTKRQAGLSAGVGLNLPVESVTLMAGGTWALRTVSLPSNTNAYITLGYAYTLRDRLKKEYEGLDVVASSVSADSLTEGRYGGVWFAAVTFGFLGGESQFKGVYNPQSKKEK